MTTRRAGRRRGFTLIELLVAISILAIVAVLGWRGLDGIIRSRQALTGQMEQTRGMQLAFAQMQSDCENLAPDELLRGRANLLAETDRLTLVRTVLTENEPSRLQVVSYRLRDGVLSRRESRATRDLIQLDALWEAARGDLDPAPLVALQTGLDGMTLRIWQANGWRSTTTGAAQQTSTQSSSSLSPPSSSSSPSSSSLNSGPSGLEVSLQLPGQQTVLVKTFLLGAI